MVRSAVADDRLISYFNNVAKQNTYSVGLILGQSLSGKDYVIHFAKTPPFHPHEGKESTTPVLRLTNINDVNEEWVADHARQATRMLPGGMHVLGIFIVSPEDLLNPFSSKIKGILNRTHRHLDSQKYLFGNPSNNEKLVLNYCATSQQFSCKSYNVAAGSVQPAEFKFLSTPIKWAQVECKYQMDQIYHISENESDWPLKKHMGIILDTMNKNLKSGVFLYDGELKDGDESIENIGKRKIPRSNKSGGHDDHLKPLQEATDQNLFEVSETGNQIRIFGHVVSKLWLNPKISINTASEAIMQDIMRSLATRLDMHWDSLTEEEHGEDMNSVHEPPRRVLIPLPNSRIAISDYLFPGEGPHDAKISLEEMLDIKIHSDSDVLDVEGQADLTEYYNEAMDSESEEVIAKKPIENNKSLYYIGLGVAFLVLIISLVIHFMQQS
ncbi:odr-4 -like protein [Asbolus verrucosus]|uniref:Odr-4-like protein n=1 Tax=Asbolus verrucosus TaxID=1661398 RepID=A0A482WCU9_ASBVE|nr:odr-4 -like protein [Asbolus verrucosus]